MSDRADVLLGRGLKLLTVGNPKVAKGQALGYATAILHLAPAWLSGRNVCAAHTAECAAHCLNLSGRGAMPRAQNARLRRTRMYFEERKKFFEWLHHDIARFASNAAALSMVPAYRLNGTSDLRWEVHGVPQAWPSKQFYDYSKLSNRSRLPPNYHLTFSYSGNNLKECREALSNGMCVAVPFLVRPETWLGYPVVDGDDHDLRFLTKGPAIVGLKAKGSLRKDPTSFFLGDNAATAA